MSDSHLYRTVVNHEWIDHNGHMNVAYFVKAFDEATDTVYETWGLGLDYPSTSGCSVFTLGMNVNFCSELFIDDPIRVETMLVDADANRIHYQRYMYNDGTDRLAARNECLCMNVDLHTRKSKAFPDSVNQMVIVLGRTSSVVVSVSRFSTP